MDSKRLKELARTHPALPGVAEKLGTGRVSRREFLRTATLLGLSSATAYSVAGKLTGEHVLPRAAAQEPRFGGTLRISQKLPEITDPATFSATQPSIVTRHIIEYLTAEGPDNTAQPWLAKSWETNEDLTVWTFHLRPGVTWNNGDAFIADDPIHNFERWLDPETGSANKSVFSDVKEIEKVDDLTFRLHLKNGKLSIPEDLYDYIAGIVHRDFDKDGGNFQENPIGTGPFLLKNYQVADQALLEKRDPSAYWGDEVYLDRLQFIDHGDDAAASTAALASENVDFLYQISIDQIDVVQNLPQVDLYEVTTAKTGVARMQVDKPPFDDRRVRKALQLCQNYERLLELGHRNRGQLANDHHCAPIQPEYAEIPRTHQDYAQARELLAEAGYPDGLEVTIDTKGSPRWELATVQALAEMARPAGITININNMPTNEFWQIWNKTKFGLTNWDHRPLAVQTYNVAYHSEGSWNETNYNNPEFDRRLEKANTLVDPEERRQVMAELEQMLKDDAIMCQPFWRSAMTAGHKRMRNFRMSPKSLHDFRRVWVTEA